ncbi:uncharacterized, partial [Tachysurus ichikawai]
VFSLLHTRVSSLLQSLFSTPESFLFFTPESLLFSTSLLTLDFTSGSSPFQSIFSSFLFNPLSLP